MRWMMRREARLLGAFEREVASRVSASLFVSEAEAALFRDGGATGRITARWHPRVSRTPDMELLASVTNLSQVSIEEYSVSNRGLRAGLVGTPESVIARLREYDVAGIDLVLLQFSPQLQEMQRFGEQVIRAYT